MIELNKIVNERLGKKRHEQNGGIIKFTVNSFLVQFHPKNIQNDEPNWIVIV